MFSSVKGLCWIAIRAAGFNLSATRLVQLYSKYSTRYFQAETALAEPVTCIQSRASPLREVTIARPHLVSDQSLIKLPGSNGKLHEDKRSER